MISLAERLCRRQVTVHASSVGQYSSSVLDVVLVRVLKIEHRVMSRATLFSNYKIWDTQGQTISARMDEREWKTFHRYVNRNMALYN